MWKMGRDLVQQRVKDETMTQSTSTKGDNSKVADFFIFVSEKLIILF